MGWISDIKKLNQKIKYSQNGEEYIVEYIFNHITPKHKYLVDLGANDGYWLSNTRLLIDKGWDALLVDNQDKPNIVKWFITRENIIDLLDINKVPIDFDFLNIDLDSNDYWILDKLLDKYRPSLILSEFNAEHDPKESKTIEYNIDFQFDNYSDWYGYTYGAGLKLAKKHGYTIIHQQSDLNIYYLRNDLINGEEVKVEVNKRRWWGGVNPNAKWVQI